MLTAPSRSAAQTDTAAHDRRVALSVTTVGILCATLNSSILLISLPAIFNGLGLNPLAPENISYLLWMLMGFLLVTAVLVVTFGRLGDQYGRAKIFNLGFLIFTIGSIGCALAPNTGSAGDNPMAVEWFAIVLGLGFVLSFGYWCTDFIVVQRALAAEDEAAAERTPLIATFPKMLFGILAIFPGLWARGLPFP